MFSSSTDRAVLSRLYTTLTKGWFYILRPWISKSFNIKSRQMNDLCVGAAPLGRTVAAAPAAALPLAWWGVKFITRDWRGILCEAAQSNSKVCEKIIKFNSCGQDKQRIFVWKVHRVQSSQAVMGEPGSAERALKWRYVGTQPRQRLHFQGIMQSSWVFA